MSPASRYWSIAAACLPPLLIGLQSVWALVEPDRAWNRQWTGHLWQLLACEFIVLLAGLFAGATSGPKGMRRTTTGALALLFGTLLAAIAISTRAIDITGAAALRLVGTLVDGLQNDPAARDARQAATFQSALAFLVIASVFFWPDLPLPASQRVGAMAAVYFVAAAVFAAWRLRARPSSRQTLTAPGVRVQMLPDAMEFSCRGAWHRHFIGLLMGTSGVLAGVLLAGYSRSVAGGLALGAMFALLGLSMLWYCVQRATWRLDLRVSAGQVQWAERSLAKNAGGRTPMDAVRNPQVICTLSVAEGLREKPVMTESEWALVLHIDDRKIWIPRFTRRDEAEALAKLFAATLKYGGAPRVRAALSAELDIVATPAVL